MFVHLNSVLLNGILKKISHSHKVRGEQFYDGLLEVERMSGNIDLLPVTIPERLMQGMYFSEDEFVTIEGTIRSYDKFVEGRMRLCVCVFVARIQVEYADSRNNVSLEGVIYRLPTYRMTPYGRQITDLMIALNMGFGKTSYIPAIAWGKDAEYASHFEAGDTAQIEGRLQSRDYEKRTGDMVVMRTAIELSIVKIKYKKT